MSGICNSCGLSFSMFRKEHSCKNCGYVFCADCLPNKLPVPKYNNEKHKVCLRCYNILTGKTKPKVVTSISPPEAYIKRCAALEEKARNQSSAGVPQGAQKNTIKEEKLDMRKYKGLGKKDMVLAERLEKLKQERRKAKPVPSQKEIEERLKRLQEDKPAAPSEQEMRERLAILKGQDPAQASKPHVFKLDTRNEDQQISDLLDEIRDEVEIDESFQPNTDKDVNCESFLNNKGFSADNQNADLDTMIGRIAVNSDKDAQQAVDSLKNDTELYKYLTNMYNQEKKQDTDASSRPVACEKADNLSDDGNEDEESKENLKKLIQQILEEQAIDDRAAADLPENYKRQISFDGSRSEIDTDELPWCCICNGDAHVRCIGCDQDLYCNRCFREGHDREDLEDHHTVPYRKKRK